MREPAVPAVPLSRSGVLYALLAYGCWGLIPLYWKSVRHVPAEQMVAHRCVWGLVVLLALLLATGRLGEAAAAFRRPRQVLLLLASGLLLAGNWLVFLWAVNHGRVLESSLGYYINPLVNVLLGVLLLRERLRPLQAAAVALAALAVVLLALALGAAPWIALGLAFSFGFYGLLRKIAKLDALIGLSVETLLLAPLAVGTLLWADAQGRGAFARAGPDGLLDLRTHLLILASGPVTAFPLLWFAHAARRLRYATLGLFQYITPTGHLLLAVLLYGERFTLAHAVSFGLIGTALALYAVDARRASATTRLGGGARGA